MSTYKLEMEDVFAAAEAWGFQPTGAYFQLNSYENRVFDLFLEDGNAWELPRVICKVYRPGRWSQAAIAEEHAFIDELTAEGITAVPALRRQGTSLQNHKGLFHSYFPRARGRMCQELSLADFRQIGESLARLHNVGAQRVAQNRPRLNLQHMGWKALDDLADWVAPEVWGRYENAVESLLEALEEGIQGCPLIRIHGDCHKGNILQTDPQGGRPEFFFVDFDDFINGLPVQDFWMLLSSQDGEVMTEELQALLSGYEVLRSFDHRQLKLIPLFRGLRILTYAHWISQRWVVDPTFRQLFPQFESYGYWVEDTEALEKIVWSQSQISKDF